MTDRSPDPAGSSVNLEPEWLAALGSEFAQPYMAELKAFLVAERAAHTVYPPGRDMFNAFWYTPLSRVRVVILGQDPYHGPNQAHGLCFSVRRGVPPPPSLVNIFQELRDDVGMPRPKHGELTHWAQQGVMLLNTSLSVRAGQAASHQGKGWERFTDRVIEILNRDREGLVFVLWGSPAGKKAGMIDGRRHLMLSAHRGFFGCRHFSRINEHLVQRGGAPIDWSLPE